MSSTNNLTDMKALSQLVTKNKELGNSHRLYNNSPTIIIRTMTPAETPIIASNGKLEADNFDDEFCGFEVNCGSVDVVLGFALIGFVHIPVTDTLAYSLSHSL